MKKIIITILYSLINIVLVASSGAEEAVEIPASWSSTLQSSTRTAVAAGLDPKEAIVLADSMMQARFEEHHIVGAQHIISDALNNGLPAGPVVNKVYEGIAKNVAGPPLLRALERVRSRYQNAFAMAKRLSPDQKDMSAHAAYLAAGLAAGMHLKDVEHLVDRLQERKTTMNPAEFHHLAVECLLTLRDVARRGVSSATVAEMVSHAADRGISAEQIRSLRQSIMAQKARELAEITAKDYSSALASGKDVGAMEGDRQNAADSEKGGGKGPGENASGDSGADRGGQGGSGSGSSGESGGEHGSGAGSGHGSDGADGRSGNDAGNGDGQSGGRGEGGSGR